VEDSGEDSASYAASALKNALAIKELARSNVFVCCQNFNVSGEGLEKLYREARSRGVIVFRFDDERPQISSTDTGLRVSLRDYSAGSDGEWKGLVEIECDLLVLPERIVPALSAKGLHRLLRVNTDSSGYFQDNNVWLKPTASNRKGILFVGACRGSFDVDDVLTEARSTALEVDNLVRAGELAAEAGGVVVNASKCALCLTCLRSCPHGAVEVVFDDATGTKAARIIDVACQACGICFAECPAKAIEMVA
jgi:heterodisulfide reductase subunit A-like polyferredoxin